MERGELMDGNQRNNNSYRASNSGSYPVPICSSVVADSWRDSLSSGFSVLDKQEIPQARETTRPHIQGCKDMAHILPDIPPVRSFGFYQPRRSKGACKILGDFCSTTDCVLCDSGLPVQETDSFMEAMELLCASTSEEVLECCAICRCSLRSRYAVSSHNQAIRASRCEGLTGEETRKRDSGCVSREGKICQHLHVCDDYGQVHWRRLRGNISTPTDFRPYTQSAGEECG